jgi:hypothetical protein
VTRLPMDPRNRQPVPECPPKSGWPATGPKGPSVLDNRSSWPRTVANRTAEYWIGVVEMLRREYRLTADEIAGKLKLARSAVAA